VERTDAARRPAFPQDEAFAQVPARARLQSWGINCAQIATIPINSVIDASAAASSTNTFNIAASWREHKKNIVPFLFFGQGAVVGQFEK
jgi:hypothetical protein